MSAEVQAMDIVTVFHMNGGAWHKFTSPQVPGLYVVVDTGAVESAVKEIPGALEKLIGDSTGHAVRVKPENTFAADLVSKSLCHYSVERL